MRRNEPKKRRRKPFYRKAAKSAKDLHQKKIHLFGEVLDHTKLNSKPCLSYVPQRGMASLRWKFEFLLPRSG